MTRVLVSGGFDPLHGGHVRYLRAAAELGVVTVALNSDAWLLRKKGYFYMPWDERREVLLALSSVAFVVAVDDADGTVCQAIRKLQPDVFAKGGDRGRENTPEVALCEARGVRLAFDVGGGKIQSSSTLVERGWGFYQVLEAAAGWKVKRIVINPGKAISFQRHLERDEAWVLLGRARARTAHTLADVRPWRECASGETLRFARGEWHQVANPLDRPLVAIETQMGWCEEQDIERAEVLWT